MDCICFVRKIWEEDVIEAMNLANQHEESARSGDTKKWKEWAAAAFKNGAGIAHKLSMIQPLQEVVEAMDNAHPYQLADREMKVWEGIWSHHGHTPPALPRDAHTWTRLPPIEVEDVRAAIRSFPRKTATGPGAMRPMALGCISDKGLQSIADVYMQCEEVRSWPLERLEATMVRLPKPEGVHTDCTSSYPDSRVGKGEEI